jgi:glucosamine--fructose-6-phosphate aminotransferase (isomerizing)
MCGIVGAVARKNVVDLLLTGLKRLEYRGYDSAGIAVLDEQKTIQRLRTQGKVSQLEEALQKKPMSGDVGIAHTRWATHGKPSEMNAHPHVSGTDIALVHNGIIENYESLRTALQADGYAFVTETDTEIVAHLMAQQLTKGLNFRDAVRATVLKLEGAYALVIMDRRQPDMLIGVRKGSPLVVGLGDNENYLASDSLALSSVTQRFIFLEEGDLAVITTGRCDIFDAQNQPVQRQERLISHDQGVVSKGRFRHFMLKEIYEQVDAVTATLEGRISDSRVLSEIFGIDAPQIFAKTKQVQIVACGTSYHASAVARYWIERLANIPCSVEVASEFRYRKKAVHPDTLFIVISQSGETADTLAALRQAKTLNYLATLAICNVPESSLVREANLTFMTRAGVEIGVASTKAFTTQLTALLLLTVALGHYHGMTAEKEKDIVDQLRKLPHTLGRALELNDQIEELAKSFANKEHALFLGRGDMYPIAMEGALKLKEISYIHAEAYPAGELKHGPLALVDANMPVIAVAPNDELLEKLKSNLQEVKARGGQLIIFADHKANLSNGEQITVLSLEGVNSLIDPIVFTIPLQLLSYHVAVIKGTDVDQPRNLAKSVTVE